MMGTLWQDIRYGMRMLWKKPGFTAVAILTLALGIGANTAIFSIVDGVLLRPLPLPEPDRLLQLSEFYRPSGWTGTVSVPNLRDWQEQNEVFTHLTAYQYSSFNLSNEEGPERILGTNVTANFFDTIGAQPALGRGFLAGEDQAGQARVVILSDNLWRRNFGGDPNIINQNISLNGETFTVVGVMPPGLNFPARRAELWVPLVFPEGDLTNRGNRAYFVLGRLKPGVTIEQARAEMDTVARRLEAQYPNTNTDRGVFMVTAQDQIVQGVRPMLLVLLGAVGFVLLIACTNVANLLLARAATRQKETAIRVALGAGTLRLVRQFLTEAVLLSALGGLAGLFVAWWGVDLLKSLGETFLPRTEEIGLDARVFGFSLLLSLLAGVAFGLAPALQAAKTDPQEALKEGGKGTSSGFRRGWLRSFLVVTEIAAAFVLLIGAGLMIKSLMRLQEVETGLRPENVLTMRLSLPPERYESAASINSFYRQLTERVGNLPGVEAAGLITHLPIQNWGFNGSVEIEGKDLSAFGESVPTEFRIISPDYFRSLRIPLVAGRALSAQDTENTQQAIIINQTMARRYWPNEDPVGARMRFGGETWGQVVGVVADVRQAGLDRESRPELYISYAQTPAPRWTRNMSLVVRAHGEPTSLTEAIRREVMSVDPAQPIYNVKTMETVINESISARRVNMVLLGSFAVISLLLAVIGIYGVMSYSVTQRTHEIGIRMALGARQRDVLKLVLGQGLLLAVVGVAIGLAAAFALTRVMSSLLYGVSVTDPVTFVGISLLLIFVALLACYIPARRATRVDPMIALRYE